MDIKEIQQIKDYWSMDRLTVKHDNNCEFDELYFTAYEHIMKLLKQIEELNDKLWIKERVDKMTNSIIKDQAKKVKHLFPLENVAGYGQLCDKLLEQQKQIDNLKEGIADVLYLNYCRFNETPETIHTDGYIYIQSVIEDIRDDIERVYKQFGI